jgi:Ca2+-binding EF-hand superfamily protein
MDESVQDFDPVLAAFRVFDRDHSSSLSADELKFYISQIPDVGHINDDDMHAVMALVDVDGDGVVSLADFRSFITAGLAPPPKAPDQPA